MSEGGRGWTQSGNGKVRPRLRRVGSKGRDVLIAVPGAAGGGMAVVVLENC